ncbi:MAG: multicopper oxidase domain-containing protein [Anaerolineae bacterium]|nr:multicopper oxidase domain-containing protein [Anaerolineae bacterium]
MRKENLTRELSRRQLLKLGAGLVGVTAAGAVVPKALLKPDRVVEASPAAQDPIIGVYRHFAATDGWIYLPGANPPYHPDNLAPPGLTTYIFGFRDVTSIEGNRDLIFSQKMKCQLTSPMFWLDEWRNENPLDPHDNTTDFTLKLTNLGLQIRPDLIDAHTLHFHGFRNAIPIFDGEPHSSVGVPIARDLTYFYRARDPGTYMFHCHFEETEHVHMGMVGGVYIRPKQNFLGGASAPIARLGGSLDAAAPMGYVYNDGDGSTAYDREFALVMNEVWSLAHWCDSHVQLPEWSDYNPDLYLMNGRAYPDTIAPNGGGTDSATGDLIPPAGRPELKYQPLSSLITCNSGDRVLIRFINLGYVEQSMRLTGIKMRVVGRDATFLRGRGGNDLSFLTDSVHIGAGQSVDAIFVAPDVTEKTVLKLFSRNLAHLSNPGMPGLGGPMTEVHIYPAGTLGDQAAANDWGGA